MREPVRAAEMHQVLAERVEELLHGHSGPSVMALAPATLLGPQTRLFIEQQANREAEREFKRRQPARPPLKAQGNSTRDVAVYLGWSDRKVGRRKDEIGYLKRGDKRQSRVEFTREAVEAFEARAA
jgi:hypothetical protein